MPTSSKTRSINHMTRSRTRLTNTTTTAQRYLFEGLCSVVHAAQYRTDAEDDEDFIGDGADVIEFLAFKMDKVRVYMRRENTSHHEPHIHICHSDKIDASVSIKDFRVLSGTIDNRTLRTIKHVFTLVQDDLLDVWSKLHADTAVEAEAFYNSHVRPKLP